MGKAIDQNTTGSSENSVDVPKGTTLLTTTVGAGKGANKPYVVEVEEVDENGRSVGRPPRYYIYDGKSTFDVDASNVEEAVGALVRHLGDRLNSAASLSEKPPMSVASGLFQLLDHVMVDDGFAKIVLINPQTRQLAGTPAVYKKRSGRVAEMVDHNSPDNAGGAAHVPAGPQSDPMDSIGVVGVTADEVQSSEAKPPRNRGGRGGGGGRMR